MKTRTKIGENKKSTFSWIEVVSFVKANIANVRRKNEL